MVHLLDSFTVVSIHCADLNRSLVWGSNSYMTEFYFFAFELLLWGAYSVFRWEWSVATSLCHRERKCPRLGILYRDQTFLCQCLTCGFPTKATAGKSWHNHFPQITNQGAETLPLPQEQALRFKVIWDSKTLRVRQSKMSQRFWAQALKTEKSTA